MSVTAKQPTVVPPQPAKKQKKPKKPKKPMPKAGVIGICVAIFIFLLGGLFACLLTNTLGLGDMLISVLPQYKVMAGDLGKREADLKTAQAKVLSDAEKVADDAKANEKAANDLKSREDALAAARQALEADKLDAASAEARRKAVVEIFVGMSPSKAAGILEEGYTAKQAADLLSLLPAEADTLILEKMEDAFAAEITKLMAQ
jgi:hypothetical protein